MPKVDVSETCTNGGYATGDTGNCVGGEQPDGFDEPLCTVTQAISDYQIGGDYLDMSLDACASACRIEMRCTAFSFNTGSNGLCTMLGEGTTFSAPNATKAANFVTFKKCDTGQLSPVPFSLAVCSGVTGWFAFATFLSEPRLLIPVDESPMQVSHRPRSTT